MSKEMILKNKVAILYKIKFLRNKKILTCTNSYAILQQLKIILPQTAGAFGVNPAEENN